MKKHLVILVAMLSVIFALAGCSSNEQDILTEKTVIDRNLRNPFAYIGDLHNVCMDSITRNNITPNNLNDYVLNFTERHYDELGMASNKISKEIPTCYEICKTADKCAIDNSGLPTSTRAAVLVHDSLLNQMPVSWISYINKINEVINNSICDTTKLDSAFSEIDNRIMNDNSLSKYDSQSLLCVSSIAKASYYYNALSPTTRASRGRRFIEADFWGAIGGVVKHGLINGFRGLMFGPGGVVVGVASSAFLGGAISSGLSLLH